MSDAFERFFLLCFLVLVTEVASGSTQNPPALRGEALGPAAFGPSVVETMRDVIAREKAQGSAPRPDPKARNGARGEWQVPGPDDAGHAHSGTRYVFNRWGDTRLGIGFGREVHLLGAWVASHGTRGVSTSGLRAVGYRAGVRVADGNWFEGFGDEPTWCAFDLARVDRVEFVARPVVDGAGWFALDDLSFAVRGAGGEIETVVVDFEDASFGARLTGSDYFGLEWERGTGDFSASAHLLPPPPVAAPAPPQTNHGLVSKSPPTGGPSTLQLVDDFAGPSHGDPGTLGVPDTNGAVGPQHYVAAPNGNLSIYLRSTGQRVMNVSQTSFWGAGGTLGDPRVAYDSHHDRFVLLASDWTERLYFAYSLSDDPTGAWFKTTILTAQGVDAGTWPDYPTLGVDADGIYTAGLMVFQSMTIFAIDKAPLLAPMPSMGTTTAWRGLPIEGAIQPCVTFGDSGGVYLVSESSASSLRLRQVTGPLTTPSLVEHGLVTVPAFSTAPDVPQAGTGVFLTPGSTRPMNAVYRGGSVWTTHVVDVGGRAGARWYEIDPGTVSTVQVGTVADPVMSYFMPSLSVNAAGDVLLGFSGSSAAQFAGAYASGRRASDPAGQTEVPILLKAGEAPYTYLSGGGSSRWGDYSVTGVDPLDDMTFWTIQEFALPSDVWGTHVGALRY